MLSTPRDLHPLAPPQSDELLRFFLAAHRIDADLPAVEKLARVTAAFAALPYENLTKILKDAQVATTAEARRAPAEVLQDHRRWGTGGTCFALTAALLHLVRALGWTAEPILADRHYGADTHCALLVWIDGQAHLVDPGYLLVRPVPLPTGEAVTLPNAFNAIHLAPRAGKIDLYTLQQGERTYRLSFKPEPADAGAFLKAWDASFDWDMMHYPVLSRIAGGTQLYLQKGHLLQRSREGSTRVELDPARWVDEVARHFGIAPEIATRALGVLKRQGDFDGRARGG